MLVACVCVASPRVHVQSTESYPPPVLLLSRFTHGNCAAIPFACSTPPVFRNLSLCLEERERKAARGPLSPRGGTSGCANNDVERRGIANRGGKKRCAFGLPLLNRVCDRAALRCSPKAKIPVRLVSSRSLRDTSGSRHFSSPLSNRRNSRAAGGRTRIRRTRRKRRAYCVANETRTVPIPLSRLQRRSSWCLFGRGFLFLSRVISRVSLSIRIAFPSFERGEARVFLFFFPPFRPTTLLYQQTDGERERERESVYWRARQVRVPRYPFQEPPVDFARSIE